MIRWRGVNVMAYGPGEALNWAFDRSQFHRHAADSSRRVRG